MAVDVDVGDVIVLVVAAAASQRMASAAVAVVRAVRQPFHVAVVIEQAGQQRQAGRAPSYRAWPEACRNDSDLPDRS